MRIIVRGKNIDLSDEVKSYINDKIGGIEKFSEQVNETSIANVEVGISTRHHKSGKIYTAVVNLSIPKNLIRVEAEAEDLYQAIDMARAKLGTDIISYKKGFISKKHRAAIIWKKIRSISPLAWLKNEFRKGKRGKEKF